MESYQLLHEKTRRSGSLTPKELEDSMLAYAKLCSDEEHVYDYMYNNKIGLHNPQFWLAWLRYYERDRNFAKLLPMWKKVRQMADLKGHPNFSLIQSYEKELSRTLQMAIRSSHMDISTYEGFRPRIATLPMCQSKYVVIGDCTVYVDKDCRYVYKLESLVEEYMKKCSFDLEFQRNRFRSVLRERPISWIGQNENRLQQLGQMLIKTEDFSEPAPIEKQPDPKLIETPKPKLQRLREMDSTEILKENFLKRKHDSNNVVKKSPKFVCSKNTSNKKRVSSVCEEEIEMARGISRTKSDLMTFSFGKRTQSQNITFNANEMARIECQSNINSEAQIIDDKMLRNVIKQSQIQRYQPQILSLTGISAIDSQKQNYVDSADEGLFDRRMNPRTALGQLKPEEVTDPQVLNRILTREVQAISDDSLGLQLLLELEPPDSVKKDTLGFQRSRNEQLLMSQRGQRNSILSTIIEQIPASDMKYTTKRQSS